MLSRTEENVFNAKLRAALSITSSTDVLVTDPCLNVITTLAFEKLRAMSANSLLKQYLRHYRIQGSHLMNALDNANTQIEIYASQQDAHRETQQENRRLRLQLEWKSEESEWMESKWKTAAKERDEAIRGSDALKAELEILRAEKDTAVAKAKEEGRQEVARIVVQNLQATMSIVGSV